MLVSIQRHQLGVSRRTERIATDHRIFRGRRGLIGEIMRIYLHRSRSGQHGKCGGIARRVIRRRNIDTFVFIDEQRIVFVHLRSRFEQPVHQRHSFIAGHPFRNIRAVPEFIIESEQRFRIDYFPDIEMIQIVDRIHVKALGNLIDIKGLRFSGITRAQRGFERQIQADRIPDRGRPVTVCSLFIGRIKRGSAVLPEPARLESPVNGILLGAHASVIPVVIGDCHRK